MPEPKILKTTFSFTVLHPADVEFVDLADAVHEAYGGHAVGIERQVGSDPMPSRESVRAELVRMGNDEEFFDIDYDDAEDFNASSIEADPMAAQRRGL